MIVIFRPTNDSVCIYLQEDDRIERKRKNEKAAGVVLLFNTFL